MCGLSPWLGGLPPEYSSPLYLWVVEDIFISLNISTYLQSWQLHLCVADQKVDDLIDGHLQYLPICKENVASLDS